MNKDQVLGAFDEVIGSVKSEVGELTGNTKLRVDGMAQEVKGSIEKAWGETKDVARKISDDIDGKQKSCASSIAKHCAKTNN